MRARRRGNATEMDVETLDPLVTATVDPLVTATVDLLVTRRETKCHECNILTATF